ncbi:MAG: hypothetical protein IPL54_11375 [Chitinophagaceae bacterium]|nr:hypothetical protein [Chitinophagaceae bacterium]
MKKIFLTTVLPMFIILAAVLITGSGCPAPVTPTLPLPCDTTNSRYMTLYNAYAGTNFYSFDMQVYEYTFKTNANGNICSVGYQGNSNLAGIAAYRIELIDATTNVVLYTGTYAFNSSARSYQSIPNIAITANQPYILRRTVVNNLGNVANTKSHFKQIPSPFVPIVNGSLTITGTKTYEQYGAASPYNITTNGVLPCIDFVFN